MTMIALDLFDCAAKSPFHNHLKKRLGLLTATICSQIVFMLKLESYGNCLEDKKIFRKLGYLGIIRGSK